MSEKRGIEAKESTHAEGAFSAFLKALAVDIERREQYRYRRVIVKVGSNLIAQNGGINENLLGSIAGQIYAAQEKGVEVILVTSGAVALGRELLRLRGVGADGEAETALDKQMYASVGQPRIMSFYDTLFGLKGRACGQVLLEKAHFSSPSAAENIENVVEKHLRHGILPVINENDVTATDELLFTDNDELSGRLAEHIKADAVILLTSVDGVLDRSGRLIPTVTAENAEKARKHVTGEKSSAGRGGMHTKFAVAERLMEKGVAVHVANGRDENVIGKILGNADIGTVFSPAKINTLRENL